MLDVSRPPRAVDMVECRKACLHIRASAHFCRRSEQNAHLTLAYLCEKFRFLVFRFCIVDKRDLFGRHALFHQLLLDVLIHIERAITLWGRQVREDELCAVLLRRVLPDLIHILNTHIDLAFRVVRQCRVCKALIQRQLASVRCDLEHIILFGFHHAAANGFGSFT